MNGGPTSNGDSMQIDGQGLSGVLIAKVDATQEKSVIYISPNMFRLTNAITYRLSKTRRKRVVPEDWADADTVQSLKPQKLSDSLYPGSRSLSLNENGELALFGGADGVAGVYSIAQQEVIQTLRGGGGNITDGLWAGSRAILATSRGTVKVFDGASELSSFYIHAGEATSIALHPSGDILASVGVDKSYVFYDLESLTVAIQIYTDSCKHVGW